ncbi:MAG: PQQ-binding-like beta-propeller repeat protein [Novosphingobium sp.]|nr:PQQ-binding-like beta-propeller repeat protein [Novosphingobium sp.]
MNERKPMTARTLLVAAWLLAISAVVFWSGSGRAAEMPSLEQTPGVIPAESRFPLGDRVYQQHCAACHDGEASRAPARVVMSFMTPEAIYRVLTSGAMRAQGAGLSEEERRAVAQHVTNTEIGAAQDLPADRICEGKRARFDPDQAPPFVNWGFDKEGTHFVATRIAGIDRSNVGTLRLKWAFGFFGANRARSQPAIGGGAIFVGAQDGSVYALDRETGCVRWRYLASAEVRTGIVLSPWKPGDTNARPLVFFGDFAGNAYAVEAFTGREVWKVEADEHPAAVLTGTPTYHDGTLYVPVSSLEEAAAAAPSYPCCTFRGSVLALDAATGRQKWRSWLVGKPVAQPPEADGTRFMGPSGVAVWSAPIIDEKRGLLYVATGDNYSPPASELSDAIVALDLATGAIRWHNQVIAGDVWNVACYVQTANCPQDAGPDFDFGAAPVLAKGTNGKEYILAGQKSGIAHVFDPDTHAIVRQVRLGRGGEAGGIHFGIAAAQGRLFVPISDLSDGRPGDFPLSPGLYALDIASGARLWSAPSPDGTCVNRPSCAKGYGAAITATPELVFAGADDGHLRIFDADSGRLLWDFDAVRPFETVNGVAARGGAFSGGAAPVVHDGQLIVPSGYGFASKMPGNVLLVFKAEKRAQE